MNIIRNMTAQIFMGLLLTLGISAGANAVLISGSIAWEGATWIPGPAGATTLTATEVDIVGNTGTVSSVTDDYDTFLNVGDALVIGDLDFTTQAQFVWSGGGFSFTSLTTGVSFQNANIIVVEGTGTATGNGFDPTVGYWNTTLNQAGAAFSFSGSQTVPAPGALSLLGIGLLGLGLIRRKRKALAS